MTTDTPRIGAHVSIAGGIVQAPLRAAQEGLETFQCFTRSPQGGPAPELTPELLETFSRNMRQAGIGTFYVHAPYYINTASADGRIRQASIRVLREELERGTVLGASYVMYHPGSSKERSEEEGIAAAAEALEELLKGYTGSCRMLVEISAGAGNVLGDTFSEVGRIIGPAKTLPGFGGVCFDTCHAFASGYDFTTNTGAERVLREFDDAIGLEWLKLTHVNDSKTLLGGKRDRHEHIGKGAIGLAGMDAILGMPAFRRIDWILETESEERPGDVASLRQLRKHPGNR